MNTIQTTNGAHTLTAVARDAAGNRTTSASRTVTVSNDVAGPVISTVAVSSLTTSGATVGWTTNEPSDSIAEYGPTAGYGNAGGAGTPLVTAHSVVLSGLSAGTLYHYRVRSSDAAGNQASSSDRTFTTLSPPPPPAPAPAPVPAPADTTPPTVDLTGPPSGATVSGTVTVSATATDAGGVVGVQFTLDGAPLDGGEASSPPYALAWNTGQTLDGLHTLTAVARDAAGHTTATSGLVTVANNPASFSVTCAPTRVARGQAVLVSWTARSRSLSAEDTVALYPAGAFSPRATSSPLWSAQTGGVTGGSVVLPAPQTPGTYQVYLIPSRSLKETVASAPLNVQ